MSAAQDARGRGSDDWVERVRAASDIAEIIGQTVSLKRVGRNWMGLCPFHDEKTPSFSVNAERQFYHCFSCRAGGDVFRYVEETEHVGFLEAVELLSRRAGIQVPERRGGAPRGQRTRLLEVLERAADAYARWLADPARGAAVRAYLERRGISKESVRTFRIGYAPEGWENLVQRLSGVPEAVLVEAGLAMRRDSGRGAYDRFRNRLMIPLVAPGGAVVGFGARALKAEDQPKYMNSPETPVYHKGQFLFGLDQARRGRDIDETVVVEGYFDAIAMHQAGLTATVATSGTALTADQARLLLRLAPRVALAYDGDAAGNEAMVRSLGVLLGAGLDVTVVALPAGDDPDTLVRRDGAAGWARAREAGLDPVAFIQRHVVAAAGPGDPTERALQTVVQLAGGINDPIRVRLLIERAVQVFGIPAGVLQRAVALKRQGQRTDAPLQAVVRERRRAGRDLEMRLLEALLHAPGATNEARQHLSPEDFLDPDCAGLARWIWQGGDGPPPEEGAAALERELASGGRSLPDWEKEARAATRALVERRLKSVLRELQEQLRHAADDTEAARLMQEIQDIGASLRALHG